MQGIAPLFHRCISGNLCRSPLPGMTGTVAAAAARRRRHAVIEIYQRAPFNSFPEDILDVPHRKLPDVVRHGGGEEQRLPRCRHPFQDLPDVRQKAHVEHAVRLVNDEDFDPEQVDFTLFREIEQASRAGHGDFGPLAELLDLGILVHPAVNGDALEFRRPAQPVDGLVDLFRQLPCRGDNQGADINRLSDKPSTPISS